MYKKVYDNVIHIDQNKINNQNDALDMYLDELIRDENDYIEFKKKIMSDKSIDNHMKSIMLQSKKEYIDLNRKKNSLADKQIAKKSEEINELIVELTKKASESKEYFNHKEYLLPKIKKWISNKNDKILLEFEMCWDIYQLINKLTISQEKKSRLQEIFQPSDRDEYENYVKIIELSIKDHELKEKEIKKKSEKEKAKKELEEKKKKELEEKKLIEKNKREELILILLKNLKKLSIFDKDAKKLFSDIEIPISKYLNLETNYITMEVSTHSQLNRFIESIRIDIDQKNNILNICKY